MDFLSTYKVTFTAQFGHERTYYVRAFDALTAVALCVNAFKETRDKYGDKPDDIYRVNAEHAGGEIVQP